MKFSYGQAVIRYCFDLTDPNSVNVPVATLLIAEGNEAFYAAVAGLTPESIASIDKMSASMLDDVPHVLKRHVDEVFGTPEFDGDISHVLIALQHSLRNTLNVKEILPEGSIDVDDEAHLGTQLLQIACDTLIEKATDENLLAAPRKPKKRRLGFGRGSKGRQADAEVTGRVPAQGFWPIKEPPIAAAGG
jgi:hypothetical protein